MFEKLLKKTISKEEIATLLKTNPKALEEFERQYNSKVLSNPNELDLSTNFFDINSRQANKKRKIIEPNQNVTIEDDVTEFYSLELNKLMNRIVKELISTTPIYKYSNKRKSSEIIERNDLPREEMVSYEEICKFPKTLRPQLTATLQKRDISEMPSYVALLDIYNRMKKTKNPQQKQQLYHHFRQGMDILDLDPILYEMLGTNPNSMGYWLPKMVDAIEQQDFFKIPETTIIKVPMNLLQLTRCEYMELTQTTFDIVNEFCKKVFSLNEEKEYFIKTGTYSSKFDFRNAKVTGAKEVRELGEYLLFIHFQANQMAASLSSPCIYGVSTTNEWVVREFVNDKENNPCIYKGLPLHTEYRVFVDFDEDKVIGINPYWDSKVMKQRFGHEEDKDSPHQIHDYIIYCSHEEKLMKRYEENKDKIIQMVEEFLPNVNLSGQWSIDIMQNGEDFWFIDMALAQNSALVDCVPKHLRKDMEEDWLPDLSNK